MTEDAFDYVIVGAGSAGCVLADRLTESGEHSVLLLEYGGSDRSVYIQMPAALSIPMNMPRYNWFFYTEPEPGLGGRRLHTPRGKVLGGSSSINGKVDTRYGPLDNPLNKAWLEAGQQAGYPFTHDMNGFQQEGFGRMDMTVGGGRRASAANAYLRPAMRRPNLAVRTHALATRVLFEGRRAIGVAYRRGNEAHIARARREVIVSAGPVQSPKLLKLSGIGPAQELARHGIQVIHDLAGVGENLQDHLEFYFQMACTQPVTLYSHTSAFRKALIGMRWLLTRDGLGASNHFEAGGFIRSRAGIRYPNIQYHFLPMAVSYDGSSLAQEHGFQAHVGPMRSPSSGWVRLASADPNEKPRVFFNYMSRPEDWEEMRACVRLTREVFAQPAFAPYRGRELQPGAAVQSDEQIDEFIRGHVESAYHPSCSCKMGRPEDPTAVVDPQTRVIGLQGLRVVDSSIMPSITTGNLNAPTLMLAEKAADHIRGKGLLPAQDAPFYVAPDWESSQR
jgi:choline dehydrogenase